MACGMVNVRQRRTPAAVVYAYATPDVQAAVKCAHHNSVRVAVAGGRHSYNCWSVVDDFLVVDTSNMTQVKVTGRQGRVLTAQVGPGNTNALLISQLHQQGYSTAGTIIGQCPSVGVSGFMLGGGQGDLSRMFGLGCDQLVGLEMVTSSGEAVTADAQRNSDLLWAACGGGGALGVITQWTLKAHDLGNEPVSRIEMMFNKQSGIPAMLKLQEFIMSDKTDLRFSGGSASPDGAILYFVGPLDTAVRLLKEAGLLNPAWLEEAITTTVLQSRAHLNEPPTCRDASSNPNLPPAGVIGSTFANYYEAIMQAECNWLSSGSLVLYVQAAAMYGFGPNKSCLDVATLNSFKTLAAQPGSAINAGISDIWRLYGISNACRLLPPLNATVWQALLGVHDNLRCAAGRGSASIQELSKGMREGSDTAYYCFALKHTMSKPNWNHLLGGAVAAVAPTATAYPWRQAISPLCVDAGLPVAALADDGVTLRDKFKYQAPGRRTSVTVSPTALMKAQQAVQAAYLKVVYSMLGEDTARGAYYNYQTNQVKDYAEAYWGPNYPRLQQIKSKWDPEGMFSKPFTVEPAKA